MFILDLLVDDFAKHAREGPGWISLWNGPVSSASYLVKQQR
jgi:hypothetical protein